MSRWPATARAGCLPMTENLFGILGIEALGRRAGRRVPRARSKTSPELARPLARLASAVPALDEDRYMAPDLAAAAASGARRRAGRRDLRRHPAASGGLSA